VNIHALKSRHTLLLGGTRAREPRTKNWSSRSQHPRRVPPCLSIAAERGPRDPPSRTFSLPVNSGALFSAPHLCNTCNAKIPECLTCSQTNTKFPSAWKVAHADLAGARRKPHLRIRRFSTSPSVVPGDLVGQCGNVPLELLLASLTANQPGDRGFANIRALKRGDTLLLAGHPSARATNKNKIR
jgi:hypothetical protein